MTILELIDAGAHRLEAAGVCFGHGTSNAYDEAAWLVLWKLGLPLDCELDGPQSVADRDVTAQQQQAVEALFASRVTSRKPTAYLTGEAWLQGVPFYVDHRAIVPRSLIAELINNGGLDYWLAQDARRALDLCTGGASLAILAAMAWPQLKFDATDISPEALQLAGLNVERHALGKRITLRHGDAMAAARGRYDLILCNPPYVNAASMACLPPEYRAEPALALAGGPDGMDFIRRLLAAAPAHMGGDAVLILEIGNERAFFEAAFPSLQTVWLETSAGADQVCALTRPALLALQASGAGRALPIPTP